MYRATMVIASSIGAGTVGDIHIGARDGFFTNFDGWIDDLNITLLWD